MLQEEVFLFVTPKIHFSSAQNRVFCEATTKLKFQNGTTLFLKILDHLVWIISQLGYIKHFHPPLVKKTNSCRIGWKWVRFELQIHGLIPMIFHKNHF